MGSENQLMFVKQHRDLFVGPVLEVGSRDYGTTADLRGLFPDDAYVGLDMLEGDGVDVVMDLTLPFKQIDAVLGGQRFGTIFCLSVLEHCDQPFIAASNITKLLSPGGRVYVSVPYAWKFHGYPSDYWRFTHEGVKKLFADLRFDESIAATSTEVHGDIHPIDEQLSRFQIRGSFHRRQGHFLRGMSADLIRLLGSIGLARWLTRFRYLMPPTMVDMIGQLPGEGD